MAESKLERDPIELLASEFVDRYRQGETPTIEEYVTAYPHLKEEIRELFPTIAAMENLKVRQEESTPSSFLAVQRLKQLGDYRLIREVGRGGMGVVYEAEQESLGRRVAVKILPRQALLDEKGVKRFQREAQTAAKLHHTNIVPIFGVGEQEGYHYFVMQFIRGVGLDQVVKQLRGEEAEDIAESAATTSPQVKEVVQAMVDDSFDNLVGKLGGDLSGSSVQQLRPGGDTQSVDTSLQADGSTSEVSSRDTGGDGPMKPASTGAGQGSSAVSDETLAHHFHLDEAPSSGRLDLTPPQPVDSLAAIRLEQLGSAYWRSITRLGAQVAGALDYAHTQGTLHRDIKPGNLLLDSHGVVWVTDFGLAKAVESDNVSHTGDVVGTLRYMSPEQFDGDADHRSDIYSLGLTLYEMLTLRPAFNEALRPGLIKQIQERDPTPPRRLNPAIPRDLETIVLKAIAHDPQHRYQSAHDLESDLRSFLDDKPIQARRINVVERLWRWCRRNRAVAALSATAILLLVMVAVVALVGLVQTSRALAGEKDQREKAEATAVLALEALESMYDQFAPSHLRPDEEMTVQGEEGQEYSVSVQPVLSQEVAAILENMLVFYDRLAEQMGNAEQARQRAADAGRKVGDIRFQLGQYDAAKAAYQNAVTIYQGLGEQQFAVRIAGLYNLLGDVDRRQGRFELSLKSHRQALTILEGALNSESSKETRYELARTYYYLAAKLFGPSSGPGFGPPGFGGRGGPWRRVGGSRFGSRGGSRGRGGRSRGGGSRKEDREQQKKLEQAYEARRQEREGFRAKAVELLTALVAESAVPDYKHLLARCYRDIPSDSENERDPLEESIKLLRELVEEYPDAARYRHDLSETLARVQGLRDSEQRRKQLEEAAKLAESLVEGHPNIPDYASNLAVCYERLAREAERVRDFDEARFQYRSASGVYERLIARYPQSTNYRLQNANVGIRLAELSQWEGNADAAIVELEELLKTLDLSQMEAEMEWLLLMPARRIHVRLAGLYLVQGNESRSDQHHAAEERLLKRFMDRAQKVAERRRDAENKKSGLKQQQPKKQEAQKQEAQKQEAQKQQPKKQESPQGETKKARPQDPAQK